MSTLPIYFTIDIPSIPITINIGTQPYANGYGELTFYAYANTGITTVDTTIDVYFTWTGDLSSQIIGTVTIYSGNNCGSVTYGGAEIGEYFSNLEISGINPSSYGAQTYLIGLGNNNTFSCP